MVLAQGGAGGLGNSRFKSSTNQAPRRSTPGKPGEERWLWLRLKLLADAGLIGLPNAGKSTFLAAVSRARPKIADYPFTTLEPKLGTVQLDHDSFVIADIPGLIEGAHEGAGLGDRFLGHIERCRVLIHLVDGTADDVAAAYRTVRRELARYDPRLLERPELVCLNKADALTAELASERAAALERAAGRRGLRHLRPVRPGPRGGVARGRGRRSGPRARRRRHERAPASRDQDRLGAAGRPRRPDPARLAGLAGGRSRRLPAARRGGDRGDLGRDRARPRDARPRPGRAAPGGEAGRRRGRPDQPRPRLPGEPRRATASPRRSCC